MIRTTKKSFDAFGEKFGNRPKQAETEGLESRVDQISGDDDNTDQNDDAGQTQDDEIIESDKPNIRRTYYLSRSMIDRLDFLSYQGISVNEIVRAGIRAELARREKRLKEKMGDDYNTAREVFERYQQSQPKRARRGSR